jgi:ATPase subunit of ABC transporter with duplicated ATPase domains
VWLQVCHDPDFMASVCEEVVEVFQEGLRTFPTYDAYAGRGPLAVLTWSHVHLRDHNTREADRGDRLAWSICQ